MVVLPTKTCIKIFYVVFHEAPFISFKVIMKHLLYLDNQQIPAGRAGLRFSEKNPNTVLNKLAVSVISNMFTICTLV
jgi:putative alpha-1,2-mannosidase